MFLSKVPTSTSACNPSPCGANSVCRIIHNNVAACSCLPGYIGSPPGCSQSEHQHAEHDVDQNQSCNSKRCGPNSICYIGEYGQAACRCEPGYKITSPVIGICFQCGSKFDCNSNQTCSSNLECVDPCPGVCGPNDDCFVFNHKASCRPKGSHPKCTSDTDCPSHEACDGYKCIDPCLDLCDHETTDCKVINHEPTCTCKTGFYGSPKRFCLRNGYVE